MSMFSIDPKCWGPNIGEFTKFLLLAQPMRMSAQLQPDKSATQSRKGNVTLLMNRNVKLSTNKSVPLLLSKNVPLQLNRNALPPMSRSALLWLRQGKLKF